MSINNRTGQGYYTNRYEWENVQSWSPYLKRTGILNSNPQYTLDVNGTIRGNNVLSMSNVFTSNVIATGQVQSSNVLATNILASNVISSNVEASNVVASNVSTRQLALYGNTTSNFQNTMYINGYNVSEPFPDSDGLINNIDWWFNVERANAPIHPSWIQDDQNILSDLWNLGETGVDIAQTLKDLWDWLHPTVPATIPTELLNALKELLDNESNAVDLNWNKLRNVPLLANGSEFGVVGDVYINIEGVHIGYIPLCLMVRFIVRTHEFMNYLLTLRVIHSVIRRHCRNDILV
jgi:hypothetical protein